ncbi:hypothetical protein D9M72_620320 [compost metagenome]
MVRLVVGHEVAPFVLEHEVDEALEHSVDLLGPQGRARSALERVAAHERVEHDRVGIAHGEPELHLHLVLLQGDRCDLQRPAGPVGERIESQRRLKPGV